ncbi:MAG: DNA-binding protein [Thermoprotei archaeon]|mgnify:CR=1 FL=1|nr:MAG: DNA-binding protein [Thermoprotei archaeon]
MKLNPQSQVQYRVKLATRYLKEAEEAIKRKDYRNTVASSQLCAENAAKAIIALYRIPSWSHDPSHELLEVIQHLKPELRRLAKELAEIARKLAPEHGRTTYGEPTRGLTPWDIYSEEDAIEALSMARRAWKSMKTILKELKIMNNAQTTHS